MPSAILDRILGALTIELEAFAVCQIGADAGLLTDPLEFVEVHHVLSGTLYLTIDGRVLTLTPGSLAIVPPRRAQLMAGRLNPSRRIHAASAVSRRNDGFLVVDAFGSGTASDVRVICGKINADANGLFGSLDGIDRPIAVDLADEPFVGPALTTMLGEIDRPQAYSRTLASALMKACLALALRRHVAAGHAVDAPRLFTRPWLARAISAVLEAPERSYSVDSLAGLSGRSRSAFARDFVEAVGLSPMEFVMQVRLDRAKLMLSTSATPIAEIALATGFASRSHFTRSFTMRFGSPPSAFRSWKDIEADTA